MSANAVGIVQQKVKLKRKIDKVFRHKKEGDSVPKWRNAGGRNKTHGTVEKVPRIDSYEASAVGVWGLCSVIQTRAYRLCLIVSGK